MHPGMLFSVFMERSVHRLFRLSTVCLCATFRSMTPKQVVKYYGSQSEAARRLGVSRQVISNWVRRKRVPLDWQIAITDLSMGRLQLDRNRKANGQGKRV